MSSGVLFCELISCDFLCSISWHLQIEQLYFFLFNLYAFYFLSNIFNPVCKVVTSTVYLSCSQSQGKCSQSFTLTCGISYSVLIDVLHEVEEHTLYSYFFFNLWILLNLWKTFSASIDVIIYFFIFCLLIWWITLVDFQIVNQSASPE